MKRSKVILFIGVLALLFWAANLTGAGIATSLPAGGDEETIRYGPVLVPAGTGPYGPGYGRIEVQKAGIELPCTDCYITGILFDVVDENGYTLNRGTNPSVVATGGLINMGAVEATCGTIGEQFFTLNPDRTPLYLPPGYGYYTPPDSIWAMRVHFKSWSGTPVAAYVDITYTTLPGSADYQHTTPIHIAQSGCQDNITTLYEWRPFYDILPGYSDAHVDLTFDRGGNIVTTFGHLHDNGLSDALEYLSLPEPTYICTSIAGYAAGSPFAPVGPGSGEDEGHPASHHVLDPGDPNFDGHIEHMDLCMSPFPVNKGDSVRLHTQYNSPGAQHGVMGNMVIYTHVTDPPDCTVSMETSYAEDTLNMLFYLGALSQANWDLWMITGSEVIPLVSSRPLPVLDPMEKMFFSIPAFPHLGKVVLVTSVSTPEDGILCSYWDAVDTGPVAAGATAAGARLVEQALSQLTSSDWAAFSASALSPEHMQAHFAGEMPANKVERLAAVFNPANGHYYQAVSAPGGINLVDAADMALDASTDGYRAYLAAINSAAENDFILDNFPQVAGELGYWLGGSQSGEAAEPDGGWQWVTDEAFVYSNWQAGQPDNDEGKENAIHYYTAPGKWNDRSRLSLVSGFVVEWEPRCTLDLDASYGDDVLELSFQYGTLKENTLWQTWLSYQGNLLPLMSTALPLIDPPVSLTLSLTEFPHLDKIGFLTTMTTPEDGVICIDWQTLDTG